MLRPGGVSLSIVSPPNDALAEARDVTATFFSHSSDAGRLGKVAEQVDAGAELLVDRTLPLDAVGEAFARQASERARGKILLTP